MQAGTTEPVNGAVKSMTGFGRGRQADGNVEVVVEVRTVNHRFLDISLRLPRVYNSFEPDIRKTISDRAHRGRFEVAISRTGGRGGVMDVALDHDLAENYHRCLVELRDSLGLSPVIALSDILTLKEIVLPVEKVDGLDHEWPLVQSSLHIALDALDEMRNAEGASLWRDIEQRLLTIRETGQKIEPLVAQVTRAMKEKLARRIQDLTGGLELDSDRLLQEVALIADRSDVTEELTRLESHVEQFLSFGKEGSPLGRKLDFLLQELQREINTLGSKSASTDIALHVVNIKAELEKIREQTQNIE